MRCYDNGSSPKEDNNSDFREEVGKAQYIDRILVIQLQASRAFPCEALAYYQHTYGWRASKKKKQAIKPFVSHISTPNVMWEAYSPHSQSLFFWRVLGSLYDPVLLEALFDLPGFLYGWQTSAYRGR